jgi:hypothetical protein
VLVGVDGRKGRALAFFLEGEFTLFVIVLVLSSTTILPSLLLRVLAVVRGLEVAVAMRELFTFPLFLGILAVSLGQFLCMFLVLVFRVWLKESWFGPVKV